MQHRFLQPAQEKCPEILDRAIFLDDNFNLISSLEGSGKFTKNKISKFNSNSGSDRKYNAQDVDVIMTEFRYTSKSSNFEAGFYRDPPNILYSLEPPHITLTWITSVFSNFLSTKISDRPRAQFNQKYNYFMNYEFTSDFVDSYIEFPEIQQEEKDQRDLAPSLRILDEKRLNKNLLISFVSNCNMADSYRMKLLTKLKHNLQDSMTFLGKCGTDSDHQKSKNIDLAGQFKFFASFENCRCPYYLTEKLFSNAIRKNVVPIVAGPPRLEYEEILPGHMFMQSALL